MRNDYLTTAKIALCSIVAAFAFWFCASVSMQLDAIADARYADAVEDSNRLPVDLSRITTVSNPFE